MSDEVEIYKIEWECWKCKKKTPVVTYFLNGPTIGSIDKLDILLKELFAIIIGLFIVYFVFITKVCHYSVPHNAIQVRYIINLKIFF